MNGNSASFWLSGAGYAVRAWGDPHEAIAALSERDYREFVLPHSASVLGGLADAGGPRRRVHEVADAVHVDDDEIFAVGVEGALELADREGVAGRAATASASASASADSLPRAESDRHDADAGTNADPPCELLRRQS